MFSYCIFIEFINKSFKKFQLLYNIYIIKIFLFGFNLTKCSTCQRTPGKLVIAIEVMKSVLDYLLFLNIVCIILHTNINIFDEINYSNSVQLPTLCTKLVIHKCVQFLLLESFCFVP